MTEEKTGLRIMSDVKETSINWLWQPYIPVGKLTILQGDPGDGKSTLMLNLAASLSSGRLLPDRKQREPIHVIYQCSEDGMGDTIKPRLSAAGARFNNIAFIDESDISLKLDDIRLRDGIRDFKAKLLVIDPLQAYVGDANLCNASGMRRMLKCLNIWASEYECAIVLISHLNKKQSSKNMYRGLGTIDLVAAARSVLQIERDMVNPDTRIIRHIKSSLAPAGVNLAFTINNHNFVDWQNLGEPYQEKEAKITVPDRIDYGKQEKATVLLKELLRDGPVRATEVRRVFIENNICDTTMKATKKILGIKSSRVEKEWFWVME